MDERLLTVSEVAERLGVNPETVRVWLRNGHMRGQRIGGRSAGWRIAESELRRIALGEPAAPQEDSPDE